MIIVCDLSYIDEFGRRSDHDEKLGKKFDIPNGVYYVKWNIPKTWNGPISGVNELEVTSGKIIVIDPCYVIGKNDDNVKSDGWMNWLNKTGFGKNVNSSKAFIIDSMGGDGCYKVKMEFETV